MVRVNSEGKRVGGADRPINTAGFIIHSVLHQRRPDVHAAVHMHSPYGRAWSTFGKGIDMLNQGSLSIGAREVCFAGVAGGGVGGWPFCSVASGEPVVNQSQITKVLPTC